MIVFKYFCEKMALPGPLMDNCEENECSPTHNDQVGKDHDVKVAFRKTAEE